jgi:hypothetical protein
MWRILIDSLQLEVADCLLNVTWISVSKFVTGTKIRVAGTDF